MSFFLFARVLLELNMAVCKGPAIVKHDRSWMVVEGTLFLIPTFSVGSESASSFLIWKRDWIDRLHQRTSAHQFFRLRSKLLQIWKLISTNEEKYEWSKLALRWPTFNRVWTTETVSPDSCSKSSTVLLGTELNARRMTAWAEEVNNRYGCGADVLKRSSNVSKWCSHLTFRFENWLV